jgi:hypothetical protein
LVRCQSQVKCGWACWLPLLLHVSEGGRDARLLHEELLNILSESGFWRHLLGQQRGSAEMRAAE